MSGVRGSCVFCAHWPASGGCLLPGYACLDHEPDKPQWSPTLAAQIALRLEEDLADARAELERNSAAQAAGKQVDA